MAKKKQMKEFEPTPFDLLLLGIFREQLFNPQPDEEDTNKGDAGMDVSGAIVPKTLKSPGYEKGTMHRARKDVRRAAR